MIAIVCEFLWVLQTSYAMNVHIFPFTYFLFLACRQNKYKKVYSLPKTTCVVCVNKCYLFTSAVSCTCFGFDSHFCPELFELLLWNKCSRHFWLAADTFDALIVAHCNSLIHVRVLQTLSVLIDLGRWLKKKTNKIDVAD